MRRIGGPGVVLCLVAAVTAGCQILQKPSPLVKLEVPPTLPQPRGSYLDLGRSFLRANELDLAKDAFIRSIRVEGMTAAALTGAGLTAERQGLLNEALRYFKRALVRAPDSVLAHNNLGAVYYRMGEYNSARKAFQAAFALSSGTNRVASHNLTLSELAIEKDLRENGLELPNPMPIERRGSGEYVLTVPESDLAERIVSETIEIGKPARRTIGAVPSAQQGTAAVSEPEPDPASTPEQKAEVAATTPPATAKASAPDANGQTVPKSAIPNGKTPGEQPGKQAGNKAI